MQKSDVMRIYNRIFSGKDPRQNIYFSHPLRWGTRNFESNLWHCKSYIFIYLYIILFNTTVIYTLSNISPRNSKKIKLLDCIRFRCWLPGFIRVSYLQNLTTAVIDQLPASITGNSLFFWELLVCLLMPRSINQRIYSNILTYKIIS